MAGEPHKYGRSECIFCGNTPTTKEHVWAQWAHDIFPEGPGYERYTFKGNLKSSSIEKTKTNTHQGPIKNARIKILCHSCNNLWLGNEYEDRFKPVLSRLYTGQHIVLTEDILDRLTEYLTAKILILDWIEKTPVLPVPVSREFYRNRTAPPGFSLHIFNLAEGDWRSQFESTRTNIVNAPEVADASTPDNTVCFAIGLGNLFVFALASTKVEIDPIFPAGTSVRLWPRGQRPAFWPPRYFISSDDAETIAGFLRWYLTTSNATDTSE